MSDKAEEGRSGRRDFMKLAGLSMVTGGAFLALERKPAEAAAATGRAAGYSETEHVRTYYQLARF